MLLYDRLQEFAFLLNHWNEYHKMTKKSIKHQDARTYFSVLKIGI